MNLTLQQLQYFRTLAKIQHYTKAAEVLFVSQPSLSYAMSELEKELSICLFEKHGKKVRLSTQGEVFLTYVEDSLDRLEEGVNVVKRLNPLTGAVNLGYIYSLSTSFMPEMLLRFYADQNNKNITFRFTQDVNSAIMDALNDGSIDLAICPKPGRDVVSIPIYKQELFVILPKSHPLAQKKEVGIEEIKDESFVLLNKKSGLRWAVDDLFKEMKLKPTIACEADECNAVITYVSLNFGVSIIPNVPGLENSDVSVLRIKNQSFSRCIYLAWKKNKDISQPVARIKDFLIANYALPPGSGPIHDPG